MHGVGSKTRLYALVYPVATPLFSILRRFAPAYVTTSEQVGRAMLHAAQEWRTEVGTGDPRYQRPVTNSYPLVRSRCCSRPCAASSISLWRHSEARYTQAISPVR